MRLLKYSDEKLVPPAGGRRSQFNQTTTLLPTSAVCTSRSTASPAGAGILYQRRPLHSPADRPGNFGKSYVSSRTSQGEQSYARLPYFVAETSPSSCAISSPKVAQSIMDVTNHSKKLPKNAPVQSLPLSLPFLHGWTVRSS